MTATFTSSAKLGSAGSTSRAPNAGDEAVLSDANMAWMLADAASVCLTGHERTMTFVELGCGENHLAIERILHAVMSNRMVLPAVILDRLTRWLDGYAGSREEPQLRTMLAQIGAQQFDPALLHTQEAHWDDSSRTAAPANTVSGLIRAKRAVPPDNRILRVGDRQPTRINIARQ